MTERLYTIGDAAAELGIPEGTIRSWTSRGLLSPRDRLAARGRGGIVSLYSLDDLRALLADYKPRRKSDTP